MVEIGLMSLILVYFLDSRYALPRLVHVEVAVSFVLPFLSNYLHLLLSLGSRFLAHLLLLAEDRRLN